MTRLLTLMALTLFMSAAAMAGVAPGDAAPSFTLVDTDGHSHTLQEYLAAGHTVVLEWFNPDCPFIRKHHGDARTMNQIYTDHVGAGLVWLAINSSAPGKQGHGLERNRLARAEYEMPMPVLLDEDGTVGRAYGAKTTPHMYIVTPDGVVAYAGAIDSDRSANKLGKTNHVAEALNALAAGKSVATPATQPYGCSVKYAQ